MKGIRIQRLEKELVRLLNNTLRTGMKDQRLKWVAISSLKLSPDLTTAKIFFSNLDLTEPREELIKLLTKSSGFMKKQIAGAKIMRTIPELKFQYDDTEERASRIDGIFSTIKAEDDKRKKTDEDDEDAEEEPEDFDDEYEDDYDDEVDDEYEDYEDYEDYDEYRDDDDDDYDK